MKLFIQVCFTITLFMFLAISAHAGTSPTLFGLAGCGANAEGTLYTIDTSDGSGTAVGSGVGFERCGGLAIDSNGTLFATCERMDGSDISVLVSIDPDTGVGSETGTFMCTNQNVGYTDLTVRNSDDMLTALLFVTGGGGCVDFGINTLNKSTGEATAIAALTGNDGCCGLGHAYSGNDTFHVGISEPGNDATCDFDFANLYTCNDNTGACNLLTAVNFPADPFDCFPRTNSLVFHPVSDTLFASVVNGGPAFAEARENYLVTINTSTGDATNIGPTVECLNTIAFSPDVEPTGPLVIIPTMGQWGMIIATILLGFFAIAALRRRTES